MTDFNQILIQYKSILAQHTAGEEEKGDPHTQKKEYLRRNANKFIIPICAELD